MMFKTDYFGKFIIEPQFTDVHPGFKEGLAVVAIGKGDKKLRGY